MEKKEEKEDGVLYLGFQAGITSHLQNFLLMLYIISILSCFGSNLLKKIILINFLKFFFLFVVDILT